MQMYFFQLLIVGAVLCANIYFEITPNGYLAAIAGIGLAFGFKAGVDLIAKRRAQGVGNRQGRSN